MREIIFPLRILAIAAWKNLDSDYLGLVHYRRYFGGRNRGKELFDSILTSEELEPMLGKYEVFVPRERRYMIETLYSHYAHTHYAEHLDTTRTVLSEKYPEYLSSYDKVVNQTHGYMFNMMIMDKAHFNVYCTWLFDILFALSKKMGDTELSLYQGRYFGRVSEIILNVWLDRQIAVSAIPRERICELPTVYTEKIMWYKKAASFLKAKYLGEKYEGSF